MSDNVVREFSSMVIVGRARGFNFYSRREIQIC